VSKKQEVGINPQPNRHLPDGWVLGEIQDLVKIRNGYAFKSEDFNVEKGVPVIRQTNLSTDTVNFYKPKFLPEDFLENYSGFKIEKGDVLIGLSGSIGSLSTYREDYPALQNQRTGVLIENVEGSKKYVEYFLLSIKRQLNEVAKGVAVQNISSKQIEGWPIPIAPLEQQKSIVAEIEKQFSRLDEAVANLKRVKANLKRYKAAVLKAAVEGKLTEEWRKQHPNVEPASKLVERILAERREKWEAAELAKMNAKGKAPDDDKWKKKYNEPAAPVISDLPALPMGWVWASIAELGDVTGGLTKNPKRATLPVKFPYLRVANVYANELRLEEIKKIGVDESELAKLLMNKDDLLIVEGNGSPDQIGRLAIWDGSINPCVHQNHLIKVRLSAGCLPNWAVCWLLSLDGRKCIRNVASSTSGLYTLSVGKVGGLPVPLLPLDEQRCIIAEIDRRLSLVSEILAQVDTNLKRAESLRQLILSKAFSGQLVGGNLADFIMNDSLASSTLQETIG